ncbi:LuxR C-terminal-related transcriptional regulator [Enterobacter sp. CC120223-11]|uniref:helix-turn-helix transcriptional regulator n=1 Tax=Enterobacter sp. CC120223-11 TaxID=1378073 RepID=UPI000BD2B293|nr:LuxR C-terminal-related transcriptional regulator [Enterobacter sp. CC120223-11]SNY71423.1 DNA-binding response regulator, NarL/FixJ family, contains REC and HTH domains [Enterobacter sp. CC120223-11]
MVNIVIKERDRFYLSGMKCLLSELFENSQQREIHYFDEFNELSVQEADIVILDLCHGEIHGCIPELKLRGLNIIIGVVDNIKNAPVKKSCFEDIIQVPRDISPAEFKEKVADAWGNRYGAVHYSSKNTCMRCCHKTWSAQQSRIMHLFYQGLSASDVACKLGLSEKTVFSHKYLAMRKFGLETDYQLHSFLRYVQSRGVFL